MVEVEIEIRVARRDDVASIVRLLADDSLGATRESYVDPIPKPYLDAFDAIQSDCNNELIVATQNDQVVGTLQLTYTPGLTQMGSWRATIEGVRIDSAYRSKGLGRRLIQWAVERSRGRNCKIVQLTSDLQRDEAIRFYQNLGFVHSHAGLKMRLVQ